MQNFIAYRSSDRAYNFLLYVISFTFLLVWLPLLRSAFDGETYQWGFSYFGTSFGGKGISSSYWFLIVEAVFYLALFLSVYWIQNRKIFYGLVGAWWIHFFGNMIFGLAQDPSASFHGDTMGVEVRLIYIILPLAIIAAALIGGVIKKDLKGEEISIFWNKKNKMMALIIFGPLPLQFLLLRFGPHLSGIDQIGVVITILQCLLIPLVLRPYEK